MGTSSLEQILTVIVWRLAVVAFFYNRNLANKQALQHSDPAGGRPVKSVGQAGADH